MTLPPRTGSPTTPSEPAPVAPIDTGRAYDRIASWWEAQESGMATGVRFLERAIRLCRARGRALDVGCGTGGRLLARLLEAGFEVTGLDVSEGMLAVARRRHPRAQLLQVDVQEWEPPETYDLILAWDSTFHLPKASQAPVIRKLCTALNEGGVLLFTAGGLDGETRGHMAGQEFAYASLSDDSYRQHLQEEGCALVLVDHDQYPANHAVLMAVRR